MPTGVEEYKKVPWAARLAARLFSTDSLAVGVALRSDKLKRPMMVAVPSERRPGSGVVLAVGSAEHLVEVRKMLDESIDAVTAHLAAKEAAAALTDSRSPIPFPQKG